MNLSETTFILPRDRPQNASAVCACASSPCRKNCPSPAIPRWERLFNCADQSGADEVALELNVGKVPVRFETGRRTAGFRRNDPDRARIRPASRSRSRGPRRRIARMATSIPRCPFKPSPLACPSPWFRLRGLENMRDLNVDLRPARPNISNAPAASFSISSLAKPSITAARLHARMIFYNGEDPATGSAAGLRSRLDGGEWRRQTRRACHDRTRTGDATAQPDFCPRFDAGMTEWLMCGSVEMSSKLFAANFFSSRFAFHALQTCGIRLAAKTQWPTCHINIGDTLHRGVSALAFHSLWNSPP